MCALQEQNCLPSNQTRLTDSALLNMALMHSIQCVSDQVLADCVNPNFKTANIEEVIPSQTEMKDDNQSADSQNIPCDKKTISKDSKSFYMSKACKYSFIASDYTSSEGQKLLSIKVFQKPLEDNASGSKGKSFLSKRSISEYFPSRNHNIEKDAQSDRGKESSSMMKVWQRTFCKPQVLTPFPVKDENSDISEKPMKHDLNQISSPEHPITVADIVHLPHKSNNSKQACSQDYESDDFKSALLNSEENKHVQVEIIEGKQLHRNYSLNPNVNFKVFDVESLSESGEVYDAGSTEHNSHFMLEDAWFIQSTCNTLNGSNISGSTSAAQLSITSSFGEGSIPTCKICHMGAKADDPLISPCRCIGTLRYIHCACLMKWLEICSKRSRKPPTCELCKYPFHWHKKFKVGQWQFPHCSWQDKILHTVFIISLLVMIGCAVITVLCFKHHRDAKTETTHLELTQSEIITLICGALFFLAFFLAMYVEIKARNTLYRLMVKFIYLNQQWYIDEYDEKENVVIDV